MKRTLYFTASLIALILCSSCDRNAVEVENGCGFTLTVEVPEADARVFTKAETKDGEQSLNENLIKSVYYYFFAEGETDQPAIVSGRFLGLNLNGEQSQNATKTWTVPVSANTVVNDLFPTGVNSCRMFVVANPPAQASAFLEGTGADAPTLEELREFQFSSDLSETQSSFVMFCDDEVEVESRTAKTAFRAVANMKRVSSKISFKVNAPCSYTDPETNQVWQPLLDGMKVEFYNGMKSANLSGNFSKLTGLESEDYFLAAIRFGTPSEYSYLEVKPAEVPDGIRAALVEQIALPTAGPTSPQYVLSGAKYYSLIHMTQSTAPLYTYPMTWEFTDQYEPYFLFELPWQTTVGGNTVIRPCYYKLMLGSKSISSNSWYDISVTLKVLGSFYKTAPVQEYLYEQYVVRDWNNAFEENTNNVDAEIKEVRFLVVQQKEYVLKNQTKLSIPLTTSHQCDFVINSAFHTKYSANNGPTRINDDATGWFHFVGNVLEFEHPLNNKLEDGMDCSPYQINITVKHKDFSDHLCEENISIIQYPSIYIYTQINSGGRSTNYGYTYVNNAQSGGWRVVKGANSSGDNSSIQFTIINVSQFDPGSGFIVGDPRKLSVDNLDKNSNSAGVQWNVYNPVDNAIDLYNSGTRTIKYYYPTIDDRSRDNYIAPSFRVNTANCRSGQNETYENAVQRCASYQEDGYPAGRWRLPTLAECKLIMTMTKTGIIPQIFINGSTYYYYYAGGWFVGDGSKGWNYNDINYHDAAARCVYDEWYWSVVDDAPDHLDPDYEKWRPIDHDITSNTKKDANDPNLPRTTFVWGDKEIN